MALLDFFWLFVGGVFLTGGDLVFKYYTFGHKAYLYGIGIVLYIVGLTFLVKTYESDNIAVASAVFVLFNIITLAVAEWLIFKDPITLPMIAGLVFAAIAILLFELG